MKALKLNKIDLIKKTIQKLSGKVCLFLNIEANKSKELVDNFIIESESSGFNNEIFFINFYNTQKILLGKACLKYSFKNEDGLQIESVILNLLNKNNIKCPEIIDSGLINKNKPFILMEAIKNNNINNHVIDIQTADLILNIIKKHELILKNNLNLLKFSKNDFNSNKKIDFEKKLTNFLRKNTPQFIVKTPYNFLNKYLNNPNIIKRSIITDRSIDNILINNKEIIMIDFSTIRIGTQFDNWIQFIDDPRVKFSCTKEELIRIFFVKNNLLEDALDFYYVSSIYTNLLQGIFTYKKNPKLSKKYIDNVNEAFTKFKKKKSVLIDIIR